MSLSVARIIEAILDDEKSVLTVSSYIEHFGDISDVCLSLPAVIGREGIREVLPIVLNDDERRLLSASAASLKATIRELRVSERDVRRRRARPASPKARGPPSATVTASS